MSDLESRLRSDLRSTGDAIDVPRGDVTAVVRRGRVRKMTSNFAIVATVVVVAGVSWQLARSTTPGPVATPTVPTTTTTTAPATEAEIRQHMLQWQQVDGPPVDAAMSLWTTQDGEFAVWSGKEIWTSPDGETWSQAVTTPDGVSSGLSEQPVVDIAGGWIGVGGDGATPTVYRSTDGETWDETRLPIDELPAENPLLVRTIGPAFIAARGDTVMIVGAVTEMPDRDAVVATLAPDLVDQVNSVDTNQENVLIRDSTGAVIDTIPLSDVDPRLVGSGYILSTIAWFSPDGETWTMTQLDGDMIAPQSLSAFGDRFVLKTGTLAGGLGTLWVSTTAGSFEEIAPSRLSNAVAVWDGRIVGAGNGKLTMFDSDWQQWTTALLPKGNGESPVVDDMEAGRVGLAIVSFDHSKPTVPLLAVLFTPDARSWMWTPGKSFGNPGTAVAAANDDRVLVFCGPGQQGGLAPRSPFTAWIGVPEADLAPGSDSGTVLVPEGLIGSSLSEVEGSLRRLGLEMAFDIESSDSVPVGQVISADPSPGTRIAVGETVTVHLSGGPEPTPELMVNPASGLPGDPLKVCGTTPGVSMVWIVLRDPATGDTWPFRTSVGPDRETGDWCWEGTIPTDMETKAGPDAGQVHPIDPGTYELRAEVEAIVVGRGTVEIGALPAS
jgi:hypothetical protein